MSSNLVSFKITDKNIELYKSIRHKLPCFKDNCFVFSMCFKEKQATKKAKYLRYTVKLNDPCPQANLIMKYISSASVFPPLTISDLVLSIEKMDEMDINELFDKAVIHFNSFFFLFKLASYFMFMKVIEEDPKYAKDGYDAYFYLGWIFEDINQIDFAIELYTESIALNPDESFSFEKRGLCLLKKKDLKNALPDLKKAEAIAKGIDGYYLHLSALIKDAENRLNGFSGNSYLSAFYV